MSILVPEEYSLRLELNNEVHARPHEILNPPERISFVAMLVDREERLREWAHLAELFWQYGCQWEESERAQQVRVDLGEFRVKVERHEEFTRYEFVKQGEFSDPFSEPVTSFIPAPWLANLPGKMLVAGHIAVCHDDDPEKRISIEDIAAYFDNAQLVGSKIGRNEILAFSDFLIHEDSFSRFFVLAPSSFPSQTGRVVLRLMEVEIYRMLALMGLPEARRVGKNLLDADSRLLQLTDAISSGSEKSDEQLLEELSPLAAQVESMVSSSYHRFAASRAYFSIVEQRLSGFHETPIAGMSTFGGFLGRRLSLARQTCDSAFGWLEQLSLRISNASDLLRTRVDVRREEQNQDVLAAMNRRFALQLYLQVTVERLSIAVFTYYSVSLIGYVLEALDSIYHLSWNTLAIKAAFVPVMIVVAFLAGGKVRRAMRRVEKKSF